MHQQQTSCPKALTHCGAKKGLAANAAPRLGLSGAKGKKMKLVSKEIGHGVTTERYITPTGKRVVILVSTVDGHPEKECHYTVLDMEGNRSGIFYNREAAMTLAQSKVL